eukprot:TRINITY_DN8078_c0_g1_i1.p1 TRINITY_DN8078_c0_g1~~TRINITY_DN8078_c0_g1_i1.p1  ORF type:complete len:435 (+),score=137.23 TRINITY_DN8078_c0_g1_i1:305-1609(+)
MVNHVHDSIQHITNMLPLTQQDSRKMKAGGGISKIKIWLGVLLLAAMIFLISKYWEAEGERVVFKEELHRQKIEYQSLSEKLAKMTEEAEIAKAERNEQRGSFEECQKRASKSQASLEEQVKGLQVELESLRMLLKTTEAHVIEHNTTLVAERNKTAGLLQKVTHLEAAVQNHARREAETNTTLKAANMEIYEKGNKIVNLNDQVRELKATIAGLTSRKTEPDRPEKRRRDEEDEYVAAPTGKPKKIAQKIERPIMKGDVQYKVQGTEHDAVLSPISKNIFEKEKLINSLDKEKDERLDKLLREQIAQLGVKERVNVTYTPLAVLLKGNETAGVNGTAAVNGGNATVLTDKKAGKTVQKVSTGFQPKVDTALQKFLNKETSANEEKGEGEESTSASDSSVSTEGSNDETAAHRPMPTHNLRGGRFEGRHEAHEL